jgi:predicted RNA-binding protein with PIN domain
MPYIIDGHNLIPKIPGLTLREMDDEIQLVQLLQDFGRLQRKRLEVFFDNSPPGQPRAQKFGMVTARFVRQGMTADEAIHNRLRRLGGAARNWTVISSDLAVQNFAREARAHFISSEEFAKVLTGALQASDEIEGEIRDIPLNSDELDDWLKLFGSDEEVDD